MKKRIGMACMLFSCVLAFSGCEAKEVFQDILSVNEAEIGKDSGGKVTITNPVEQPKNNTATPTPTKEPTPTPTEEPKEMVYCISPVNVREGSSNQAAILGALTAGQAVEKLGEEKSWIKIRFEGKEGWVYGKYVTSEEPG